jgi:hypothetical protein
VRGEATVDDQTRDVGHEPGIGAPSRSLLRLLDRHAHAAAALGRAEAAYRQACAARPSAADGKRGGEGGAFEVLAESVVELQTAHAAVVSYALEERLTVERLRALDATFAASEHELGAYLAARTYSQVRAAASRPV